MDRLHATWRKSLCIHKHGTHLTSFKLKSAISAFVKLWAVGETCVPFVTRVQQSQNLSSFLVLCPFWISFMPATNHLQETLENRKTRRLLPCTVFCLQKDDGAQFSTSTIKGLKEESKIKHISQDLLWNTDTLGEEWHLWSQTTFSKAVCDVQCRSTKEAFKIKKKKKNQHD